MRRRDLAIVFGTALLAPGRSAFAEAAAEKRRIGALFSHAQGDAEGQARVAAFRRGLSALGWSEDRNLQIDFRWAAGSHHRMQALAAELVSRKPDVILAGATSALVSLQRATRTVPIVFAQVSDPVGAGFIASLARPGGNITGLTQHEFAVSEKWVELLKQVAPRLKRAAVLYDPDNPSTVGYLRVAGLAAPSHGLALSQFPVRDRAEIARAINEFAVEPDGGLILLPGLVGTVNRDIVIALAARHRLPSIFAFRYHVLSGGLLSYGVDNIELYRRAAWYVDRILKGAKPGEMPVEHASKFQLVINLKTAKALGLDIPLSLLTSADEVIE